MNFQSRQFRLLFGDDPVTALLSDQTIVFEIRMHRRDGEIGGIDLPLNFSPRICLLGINRQER